MKLNIFVTEANKLFDQNVPLGGFQTLDSLVDDAECDVVRIESLDYIPINEMVPFMEKAISKLRHEGTLKVQSTDLVDMGRVILERNFSTEQLNNAIYGEPPKRSALPLDELVSLIKSFGLKIKIQRLQNTMNYVEAIRE